MSRAAWTVPAALTLAPAPAFAASGAPTPGPTLCPNVSLLSIQGGSSTMSVAAVVTSNYYTSPMGHNGTLLSLSLGAWNVPMATTSDGTPITGFYVLPGRCDATDCKNYLDGVEFTIGTWTTLQPTALARVTASTPIGCSPQVDSAGLVVNVSLQTNMDYWANQCNQWYDHMRAMSLPVTIINLNGLTPVFNSAGMGCCYYLNVEFDWGCQPNKALSYSWTTTPLYPPFPPPAGP